MVIFELKNRGTCFSKSAAMFFTFNAVKCTEVVVNSTTKLSKRAKASVH